MKSFALFFVLLSFSSAVLTYSKNTPRACTGVLCITERQFYSCDAAEPDLYTCPFDGQFCDNNSPGGCANSQPAEVASICGTCRDDNGPSHACLSPTTFTSCTDNVADLVSEAKPCSDGTICDWESSNHSNPCSHFTGDEFVCWREIQEPSEEDTRKCEVFGEEGKISSGEKGCFSYLYCKVTTDEATGDKIFTSEKQLCPLNYLFDPVKGDCVSLKLYKTCPNP